MFKIIQQWFNRYFSDPEAVLLFFILVIFFALIIFLGNILAPVLASIVFAYLLNTVVNYLQKFNIPHLPAVIIVFIAFMGLFLLSLIILLPLLWKQLASFFQDLPTMLDKGQKAFTDFSSQYPEYISNQQISDLINSFLVDMKDATKVALTASLASITSIIHWLLYLVLMPLLLFFFLKDRKQLMDWAASFLPPRRSVLRKVSHEVNDQIGNYIRGKVVEIIIVFIATYIVFAFFGLQYALLLAFLVGFSVLIPYVGIVVISLPVALVAYLQWGFTSHFWYLMIAYFVVQGLDGSILVPLLFSEAVQLHPVAIIVATLFFGGIWGFWGVFFAIPLATLVKAVINAWPHAAKHG